MLHKYSFQEKEEMLMMRMMKMMVLVNNYGKDEKENK